jgi:hypothetical protein
MDDAGAHGCASLAEANSPQIAEQVVRGILALAGVQGVSVTALPRHTPMHWSSDMHGKQLALFD